MKWYVLVTRSRHEKKYMQLLQCKGFEIILPIQKVMRQWSDRKKIIEVPLFSGYLFIRYDELKRLEILNVPGIVRFVRYDKHDATISESQIRAIRMAIDEEIEMDVTELNFSEGEEIRIASGPFKDFYGKIINHKSKKKIMISINTIGKNILIETGKTRIEKIPQIEQKPE